MRLTDLISEIDVRAALMGDPKSEREITDFARRVKAITKLIGPILIDVVHKDPAIEQFINEMSRDRYAVVFAITILAMLDKAIEERTETKGRPN